MKLANVIAVGVVLLVGCSPSSPGGDAGGPPPDAGDAGNACASYGATYCNYLNACNPGTLQAEYGTVATCFALRTSDCNTNIAATGSGLTPSFLSACGASLTTYAQNCATKPVPNPVPTPTDACALVGKGAAGSPCGEDVQCATDSCNHAGSLCGTCNAQGALGEGCDDATGVVCARGMTCSTNNGTCVTTVGPGATCDLGVTNECVAGTGCVIAATGDTGGTCQALGVAVGTACNVNSVAMPGCWAAAGFFCNTTSNQCAAITYGAPGASCAATGTADNECAYGSCAGGTCASPVAAGGTCTLDAPPTCADGSVCVASGATGTCTAVTSTCTSTTFTPNFSFQPSNISLTAIDQAAGMAADENISAACSVTTDATSPGTDCFTSPITAVKQPGGTTVNLVVVRSLDVQAAAVVTVTGGVPLVIVSLSDVIWYGQLAANSSSTSISVGAGGGAGAGTNAAGSGAGGGKAGSGSSIVGGGGGSYCGVGGAGGGTAMTTPAYGSTDIRPLVGGSSGGGGTVGSGPGGGGVQIVAAGLLALRPGSSITVGGAGGPSGGLAANQNAGGAGSGGSILLEGQFVNVFGTLAANGGGGGGDYANTSGDATANATAAAGAAGGTSDAAGGAGAAGATVNGTAGSMTAGINAGGGGGGAGRIRINTTTGTAGGKNAVYSPATTTPCMTQGMVRALGSGA